MSRGEITLYIDGIGVTVPDGTNVVDAAHEAGIEIPIFCHHPFLEPVGMCRMCLVEVGMPAVDRATGAILRDEAGESVIRFQPKLVAGCTTPVADGMVVRTATPEVTRQRLAVLELLLTSHPLDCPVCDKGGECPLQNLTMRYGPGRSRFVWGEKYHFPKPVPIGPLVALDRERCVLCARCIRFQEELAGDRVLGFESRGRGMEVVSFSDPPFDSVFSGNTTDICPVGALTSIDFRFEARVWEVVGCPGVCIHCAVGCNLMYDTRNGRIERVMPRRNDWVNDIWLCDKGRFAHHFASAPTRLTTPLVRRGGELVEASWDEALARAAEGLHSTREAHGPGAIGGIAGDHLPNEDLYLFGRLLRAVLGTNNVDHLPGIVRDDTIARLGAAAGTRLADLGAEAAVLVVGLDPGTEAPLLHLGLHAASRRGTKVVVVGGRPTSLDEHAASVLRGRYGAETRLVAALAGAVVALSGDRAPAAAREWLARTAARGTSGTNIADDAPDDAYDDIEHAAEIVAAARDVLIVYGREAVLAGLVPALAALASCSGRPGRPGNGLLAVGPHANGQGAADMGLLPDWLPGYRPATDASAREDLSSLWPGPVPSEPGLGATEMLRGGVRALLLLGVDPAGHDALWTERPKDLDLLVVTELFSTESARLADVVLPALSAAERSGSFTNMLRRVQRFEAAARPMGRGRADWRILRDLGVRLGVPEPYDDVGDVFGEIARAAPIYSGISYEDLARPTGVEPTDIFLPFAPQTAARSVDYLGTAYPNRYGEGVVWPVAPREDAAEDVWSWEPEDPLPEPDGLVLVPVRALFDAGTMVEPSVVLHPLVRPPHVLANPADAAARGLADGARVIVEGPGGRVACFLRVAEGVSPGVVLAPESLRWPLPVARLIGGARPAVVTVEAEG